MLIYTVLDQIWVPHFHLLGLSGSIVQLCNDSGKSMVEIKSSCDSNKEYLEHVVWIVNSRADLQDSNQRGKDISHGRKRVACHYKGPFDYLRGTLD